MNVATSEHFRDSKRAPKSLDYAWRLAESSLPDGWRLIELSYLAADHEHFRPTWYASAHDPSKPHADHVEAEDVLPVRALLALARALHRRKHRVGRPPIEHLPPPLSRQAGRDWPIRSHDMGTPASIAS